MDFSKNPVLCTLYYEDQQREVETVKVVPLVAKPSVAEDGETNVLECRIKVLSSQHEGSPFRVRFQLLDGSTGQMFEPDMFCWSESVRIVSKPEQLSNAAKPEAKAQKIRGMYLEQLEEIRDTEERHVQLLRRLVDAKEAELRRTGREEQIIPDYVPTNYAPAPNALDAKKRTGSATSTRKRRRRGGDSDFEDDDDEEQPGGANRKKIAAPAFDGCFFRFIAAFSDPSFRPQDKAEQLRRAVRALSASHAELWEEFLKLIAENTTVPEITPTDFCCCEGCPHRQKVLNMDLIFGVQTPFGLE